VAIQSPSDGQDISGTVSVVVSASDNVRVAQVTIYVDGIAVATDTASPYTYSWNTKKSSTGVHTISARAWDGAGNMTVSADSKITISKTNGR
jgi:hypothetical protein